MKNDQFANIAAEGVLTAGKGLKEPAPEIVDKKVWRPEKCGKKMVFPPKMCTKEELYKELEEWKVRYRPFLKKMAPELTKTEKSRELKEYQSIYGSPPSDGRNGKAGEKASLQYSGILHQRTVSQCL